MSEATGQCAERTLIPIQDFSIARYEIKVVDLTPGSLDDANQGVCEIRMAFRHGRVGDIRTVLTSPSGDEIQLIGPISNTGGTDLSSWEISFVPCGTAASPDPGFADQWNNAQPWAVLSSYTGSYYPYQGCLGDFSGSAIGTWTLEVFDGLTNESGVLEAFEIVFCSEEDLSCEVCIAEAGTYDVDTTILCIEEDSLLIDEMPVRTFIPPDTAYAFWHFILDGNGVVQWAGQPVTAQDLGVGEYVLCGLSFLDEDSVEITEQLVPSVPLDSILTSWEEAALCYDVTSTCRALRVRAPLADSVIRDSICLGDTLIWEGQMLTSGGRYEAFAPGANGCLQARVIELFVEDIAPEVVIDTPFACFQEEAVLRVTHQASSVPSIAWSSADGQIISSQNAQRIQVENSGTYVVELQTSFANGLVCQVRDSVTLLDDFVEPLVSYQADTITCSDTLSVLRPVIFPASADVTWRVDDMLITGQDTIRVGPESSIVLLAMTASGCEDSLEVTLIQDTLVAAFDLPDLIKICPEDQVQVTRPGFQVEEVVWELPDGSVRFEDTLVIDTIGRYTLCLTYPNGCSYCDDFQVDATEVDLPVDLQLDTFRCISDSVNFLLIPSTPLVSWTIRQGLDTQNNTIQGALRAPGMVHVEYVTALGCSGRSEFNIPRDTSEVDLVLRGDTLTCAQTSSVLSVENLSDQHDFVWASPLGELSNDRLFTTTEAGLHTVIVQTIAGCELEGALDVVIDTVHPDGSILSETLSCSVDSVRLRVMPFDPANQLLWELPSGDFITDSVLVVVDTGIYQVTATRVNGCTRLWSVPVLGDYAPPTVDSLIVDTLTCEQETITAEAVTNAIDVIWTEAVSAWQSMDNPASLPRAGDYRVTLVGANGCDTALDFAVAVDTVISEVDIIADTLMCDRLVVPLSYATLGEVRLQRWTFDGVVVSDMTPLLVSSPGQYVLDVVFDNGCALRDSVDVVGDTSSIMYDLFVAPFDCVDSTSYARVEEESSYEVSWTRADGSQFFGDSIFLPSFDPVILMVRDTYCTIRDTLEDFMLPTLVGGVVETDSLSCFQEVVTWRTVAPADVEVSWAQSGMVISSSDTVSITSGDPVTLTWIDENRCQWDSTILVVLDTMAPVVAISTQGRIRCDSQSVRLLGQVMSDRPIQQWAWSTDDGIIETAVNSQEVVASGSGLYQVQITAENGCQDSSVMEVIDSTQALAIDSLWIEQPDCFNGYRGSVEVLEVSGGEGDLRYALRGGGFQTDAILDNLSAGSYELVVQDAFGCEASELFEIRSTDPIVLDLGVESVLCIGQGYTLRPEVVVQDGAVYALTWWRDGSLLCEECEAITDTATMDHLYEIELTEVGGCVVRDTLLLRVEDCMKVYLPNAFSPNGDGVNDRFEPVILVEAISRVEMTIYDRWGGCVHEFTSSVLDPDNMAWGGTVGGEDAAVGVYTYKLSITPIRGRPRLFHGEIHLLR